MDQDRPRPPERVEDDSAYSRALVRVRGRPIWWFLVLAVMVAFIPVSTPVLLVIYGVLAVAFWIPLGRRTVAEFRRGARGR